MHTQCTAPQWRLACSYISSTYAPAIPCGIICGLARHLEPGTDRDGNIMPTPGFPSPKAVWHSQQVENFWIALVPSHSKNAKEVHCCVDFVAPVAPMGTVTVERLAVAPSGGRGGAGTSRGERPASAALVATVPFIKLSDATTSKADVFYVNVQLQRQVRVPNVCAQLQYLRHHVLQAMPSVHPEASHERALQVNTQWEAVADDVAVPVNIGSSISQNPCPKSFKPAHTAESRLYRVSMPRELPQLEPGKYRFAVTVTHTLLTRRAQQSATRQQAPILDEDALATSYLPIDTVQVRTAWRWRTIWSSLAATTRGSSTSELSIINEQRWLSRAETSGLRTASIGLPHFRL